MPISIVKKFNLELLDESCLNKNINTVYFDISRAIILECLWQYG